MRFHSPAARNRRLIVPALLRAAGGTDTGRPAVSTWKTRVSAVSVVGACGFALVSGAGAVFVGDWWGQHHGPVVVEFVNGPADGSRVGASPAAADRGPARTGARTGEPATRASVPAEPDSDTGRSRAQAARVFWTAPRPTKGHSAHTTAPVGPTATTAPPGPTATTAPPGPTATTAPPGPTATTAPPGPTATTPQARRTTPPNGPSASPTTGPASPPGRPPNSASPSSALVPHGYAGTLGYAELAVPGPELGVSGQS
jgi:hypothetical protein